MDQRLRGPKRWLSRGSQLGGTQRLRELQGPSTDRTLLLRIGNREIGSAPKAECSWPRTVPCEIGRESMEKLGHGDVLAESYRVPKIDAFASARPTQLRLSAINRCSSR